MRCNVQFSNLGEKEKQWCARGKIYFFSSTSVNGLESKGWSLIDMHTMSRYADCMHMKCGHWPICWYAFKGMVVVVGFRTCRCNSADIWFDRQTQEQQSSNGKVFSSITLMPERCWDGFPAILALSWAWMHIFQRGRSRDWFNASRYLDASFPTGVGREERGSMHPNAGSRHKRLPPLSTSHGWLGCAFWLIPGWVCNLRHSFTQLFAGGCWAFWRHCAHDDD